MLKQHKKLLDLLTDENVNFITNLLPKLIIIYYY